MKALRNRNPEVSYNAHQVSWLSSPTQGHAALSAFLVIAYEVVARTQACLSASREHQPCSQGDYLTRLPCVSPPSPCHKRTFSKHFSKASCPKTSLLFSPLKHQHRTVPSGIWWEVSSFSSGTSANDRWFGLARDLVIPT